MTSSRLEINSKWYMDSDVIECLVTQDLDSLGENMRFKSTSSSSVQLLVRFSPEFQVDRTKFRIVDGQAISQLVVIEDGLLTQKEDIVTPAYHDDHL
ncbi:hypothetical protein Ciccas_006388 [Cichlidogyrus casuarinus]|uniref:Uncharacterized protein n=1 Tax=Cichlidogyrus casuarinus TaxID=1844966 RepID=A0ABD2Q8A6_9PLAT